MTTKDTLSCCPYCAIAGDNHVKPCNTPLCDVRYHEECLKNYAKKSKVCIECKAPILTSTVKQFNGFNCLRNYLGTLYTLLLLLSGPFISIALAMGLSLWQFDYARDGGVTPAIGFLVLPFILMYMQCPGPCFCCRRGCYIIPWRLGTKDCERCWICYGCSHTEEEEPVFDTLVKDGYGGMTTLFLGSHCAVAASHLVGYPIVRYLFHRDTFFTAPTGCAGLVVYYLGMMCYTFYNIFLCVKQKNEEAFQEEIEQYGTLIRSEE